MRAVAAEARSNSQPRVVPGHASQIDVEAVGARRRFRHSRDAQARAAGLAGPGLRAHAQAPLGASAPGNASVSPQAPSAFGGCSEPSGGRSTSGHPCRTWMPSCFRFVTDVSWNHEVKADPAVHAEARHGVGDRAGGRRPGRRVPEVHRVLPLPGRVPHSARSPAAFELLRAALPGPDRKPGDASARHARPARPHYGRG